MSENRVEAGLDLAEQAQHDRWILSSSIRFHLSIFKFLLALSQSVIILVVPVDGIVTNRITHQSYDTKRTVCETR